VAGGDDEDDDEEEEAAAEAGGGGGGKLSGAWADEWSSELAAIRSKVLSVMGLDYDKETLAIAPLLDFSASNAVENKFGGAATAAAAAKATPKPPPPPAPPPPPPPPSSSSSSSSSSQQSQLEVRVIKAVGLAKADRLGHSDPYATVHFGERQGAGTGTAGTGTGEVGMPLDMVVVGRTRVIDNTADPVWGESFTVPLHYNATKAGSGGLTAHPLQVRHEEKNKN
jgi:hypothetical protein